MKNFGFTLAEVLITLGIIGVVAALTTPALVKNSGTAKIGPTLAKFVNTIETGCEQMMHEEQAGKLTDISPSYSAALPGFASAPDFMNKFSKYVIMSPITDKTVTYQLKNPDGSTLNSVSATGGETAQKTNMWELKDGSLMIVWSNAATAFSKKADYTGSFTDPVMFIIYDINGLKGNNIAGKEAFGFILDNNGTMIAANSNADKIAFRHNDLYFKDCGSDPTSYQAGLGCTGVYADNGWSSK